MWWLWLFGFFSAPALPASGHIVKGDIRVYRSPVITRDEAATIRGSGRYAILERGERCAEGRWWKIAPFYWVCSGWFVSGEKNLVDLKTGQGRYSHRGCLVLESTVSSRPRPFPSVTGIFAGCVCCADFSRVAK
jgi:hypothetical protein